MTDLIPLVKSHPSVQVRRLLTSAELDVPNSDSKARTLLALSQMDHRNATTNFSGIALGTTVNRLIGAVTLYGSQASPWRLLARGSFIGAAAGAMALVAIVTWRWAEAPASSRETAAAAAQPLVLTGATTSDSERDAREQPALRAAAAEHDARVQSLLRGAAIELDAGRAEVALQSLEALLASAPPAAVLPQATLLKAKALARLGRIQEAKAAAARLSSGSPESMEWNTWYQAQ